LENVKTIRKSQFVITHKEKPNIKKNQTNKQINNPWHIHTCVWRKNSKESFFLWVMMMMIDKGTNLSMDDDQTICGIVMSLHLRELEDFGFCDHFDTNPNLLLQQNPSSLQSLCVVVSTTTTKKQKIPKTPPLPNKTNPQTPNKRNFTHTQQHNPQTPNKSNCTNTQLNNPKTTRQEKFHKHSTRDLKLTNTKSKSTKHPTRREIPQTSQHPTTRENPQTTQHPTKRESTTTQREI
jgi:hypothetical protein